MKTRQVLLGIIGLLATAILPVAGAGADTLYSGTSLVQGDSSFTQSFNVTTPGTLTVTLTGIPWLDPVSGLTSFLSTANGVVGSGSGTGSQAYNVSAGTVYAHWFGEAQGLYNLGVIGVNVSFQAISSTPVGLPTSLVLMLSGLGLLFGWQKHKTTANLC